MQWKNRLALWGGISVWALGLGVASTGFAIAKVIAAVPVLAPLQADESGGAPTLLPAEKVNYDEVGYASWYGEEMAGRATASGEVFAADAITGAHRTLPLSSFVEVTNLDSGRTILVRVNDRGPFRKGRIIDLSAGAARQLGIEAQGEFPVRVRRVNPPAFERRQLQNGGQATERLPTPPALLAALRRNLKPGSAAPSVAVRPTLAKPPIKASPPPPSQVAVSEVGASFDPPTAEEPVTAKPMRKPKPLIVKPRQPDAPAAAGFYVQLGAFSSEERAQAFAQKAGASVLASGSLWRVRMGPYGDEATARAALGPLAAKGYGDARVTR